MICPRCHFSFSPDTRMSYKLVAWQDGYAEPAVDVTPPPSDTTFAVAFASPPATPGGVVHVSYAGEPKPSHLFAVYVPTGSVAPDGRTAALLSDPLYSRGEVVVDPAAETASITVTPPPAPGVYDIGVFGLFAD